MEAASFLHYIRHRSLVSLQEINARLVFMTPEEPHSTVSAELERILVLICPPKAGSG